MLYGAHIVWGYERENDKETVYAEEHIYLVEMASDISDDEDVFWNGLVETFDPLSPALGSKKFLQHPDKVQDVEVVLFHRNIRNISNVGVTSEGFNSELTDPLLITSRSFVFKSRDEFFEYANGINVDVDTDDPIHVQAIGL